MPNISFRRFAPALVLLALLVPLPSAAQAPPMRTRDLTRMSNISVQQFLERSDVIFVPVGDIESNGVLPSDLDYTTSLAIAMKMAEAGDGLYLPYLAYFYPGSTAMAEGTVFVTPSQGTEYLKVIAKSLLRQGFRRQVYVTAGHGPAVNTVGPLIREFFDETKVPILYIEARQQMRKMTGDFSKVTYGAYSLVGRLEDLPLGSEMPVSRGAEPVENPALSKLSGLGPGGASVGFYVGGPNEHGGLARATNPEQRAQWAKEGEAQIAAAVRALDLSGVLQALREHDRYTQQHVVSKYKETLP